MNNINLNIESGVLKDLNIDDPENIVTLDLSYKNIYFIDEYVFFNEDNTPKLPNLKKIDLSNNSLSNLNFFIDLFQHGIFENLEILNLNNNNITNISSIFFTKMPKLKELHLAYNKINIITNESFCNEDNRLEELEYIYLNNNYISQLHDELIIIKSNIPFLNSELYNLNEINLNKTIKNIEKDSLFKYLNDKVVIDLHNNLLIKCDVSKLEIKSFSRKVINYAYTYNTYLNYYYHQNRLLFNRYDNHYDYINHIHINGIHTFMDYFIYFIYKSLPSQKKDVYLSYFLIINGNKNQKDEPISVSISNRANKILYFYNHTESQLLNINKIINNIKDKIDITSIYTKDLNKYIEILFKIKKDFFKQNDSILIKLNMESNEDNENNENKKSISNDYLYNTFVNFNDMIYNLNSNIYLKNSDLTYTCENNILFINNLYLSYNDNENIDSIFKKEELNDIFYKIIIHFNESINTYTTTLKSTFEEFNKNYIFPENISNINQTHDTIKYYQSFEENINFLMLNIEYIILDDDEWDLLIKSEYKNNYKSILEDIYKFLKKNNFYLYFLLVNNEEFMRYSSNTFISNIINLYKKCSLHIYINESKNIIFYNFLKYLNLYDHDKDKFNINHLTSIQIDSLIDYYIMYMNELYKNYNIQNEYILNAYNSPINLVNNGRINEINNYIIKYLFIAIDVNDIKLKYNHKSINKYFYKTYIEVFFDKFRIISGHGTTIPNVISIIPENQTVYFLAKSKVKLTTFFSIDNKYKNNIPYQGVYERGLDKYDNYYITRPMYKTEKYNSGMLCESYNINPKTTFKNKKKMYSLNENIDNTLQYWRYGGIFEVKNIFKNICKLDSYLKYANPKNRNKENNIFINSIYNNIKNNYSEVIDYEFIVKKEKANLLKKMFNNGLISSSNSKRISKENEIKIEKEMNKKMASYKNKYIDFLQKILFSESDQSYFNRNEMMYYYLSLQYSKRNHQLINFLIKNSQTPHTYFIHMCRGTTRNSNNRLLKHVLKNIIKLHHLVESKKKYINKLISNKLLMNKNGSKNSNLTVSEKNVPVVENNLTFLKNINVKGTQLLNKNNSQISLSSQFTENHFDINNYNLYKIYEDISHIINIYKKNYPKEINRDNYHLNIIVEGLEELYHFIYETYEILYGIMYKILKKLLVLKKLVFKYIDIELVEGVDRLTYSNISQSYKKQNGTNILQLSEENKERYKVPKNIKLKNKFIPNFNIKGNQKQLGVSYAQNI